MVLATGPAGEKNRRVRGGYARSGPCTRSPLAATQPSVPTLLMTIADPEIVGPRRAGTGSRASSARELASVEPTRVLSDASQVPPATETPRVFDVVADSKGDALRGIFVGPIVELDVPEEVCVAARR